jgi:hypothetical protein
LKLIGFAIWQRRGAGRNVTFPHVSTASTVNSGPSRCFVRSCTPARRTRSAS